MAIGRELIDQLAHLLRPIHVRLANSIARSVVQLVNDLAKQQLLQLGVLVGEDIDDGEHFQAYGFSSVPFAGAEAVVLFPNGDRGHPLVVAVADRRYRPTGGEPGEVTIYTDEGDKIRLGRGHVITIETTGQVRLGSASAAIPVALTSELAALKAAVAAWTPVPHDGGASLQAVFATWLAPGASKVRAE